MEPTERPLYAVHPRIPPEAAHAEFTLDRPRPGVSAWREGLPAGNGVSAEQRIVDICSYYERRCGGKQSPTSLAARLLFQMSREIQTVLHTSTVGTIGSAGAQNVHVQAEKAAQKQSSARAQQRGSGRQQSAAQAKQSNRELRKAEFIREVRERELAESSAELEAWEASWLYPWKMGDDVAHLPRLVQVQQPGDALYELGVVVVEGRDSAGAPAAPGCVAADPRRADEKQRSGQRDAGSVSSGGAALEDAMDNPLHETSPADGDDLNSIETV